MKTAVQLHRDNLAWMHVIFVVFNKELVTQNVDSVHSGTRA